MKMKTATMMSPPVERDCDVRFLPRFGTDLYHFVFFNCDNRKRAFIYTSLKKLTIGSCSRNDIQNRELEKEIE